MISFVLLMALHPEIQRCAQTEIDEVVGLDNIPDVGCLDKLVYLTAVYKEVLRYAPIANLGTYCTLPQHNINSTLL